jgi:predicted amidohydrolase
VFARHLREQAAWLGVPVIAASACGTFHSRLLHSRATMLGLSLLAPRLLAYVAQAAQLDVTCDMVAASQVIDAQGRVIAQLDPAAGESCALAEVALAGDRPMPHGPPPGDRSFTPLYLASDLLMPLLCRAAYRRGLAALKRRPPRSQKTSEV